MRDEELRNTGIDVIEYDWWDPTDGARAAHDVMGDTLRIVGDTDAMNLRIDPLPGDFAQSLRWSLASMAVFWVLSACFFYHTSKTLGHDLEENARRHEAAKEDQEYYHMIPEAPFERSLVPRLNPIESEGQLPLCRSSKSSRPLSVSSTREEFRR